jgi:hypothetical protein
MPETTEGKWERLPDRREFVDVTRLRLPEGWLVHAAGVGGTPRCGALVYYPDAAHEWQHLEHGGVLGTSFLLWEKLSSPAPDGFTARLNVPGGWFVYVDIETENSSAQMTFCPDREHKWGSA